MSALRVAVWGLGRHAVTRILPALASVSGLTLYGVCSRNDLAVEAAAKSFDCHGWTDADDMLSDPDVDVVYVSTPIALHHPHGLRVLESAKHLWCEKPLTGNFDNSRELVDISRRRALCLCEAHMYLFHPQFLTLCEMVQKKVFGPVSAVNLRFGIPKLDNPGFRSVPALGGGAFLDVGCYPVSAVHALFPGESSSVLYASISTTTGAEVDTAGEALLSLSGGARAHLEWRTGCSYRNEIDLWAENGSVFADKVFSKPADYVPVFRVRDGHGNETTVESEACNQFEQMLAYFRCAVMDSGIAESERGRILERASTMDLIRNAAGW